MEIENTFLRHDCFCGKAFIFSSLGELGEKSKKHFEEAHKKLSYSFPCPRCGETFHAKTIDGLIENLLLHQEESHNIPRLTLDNVIDEISSSVND